MTVYHSYIYLSWSIISIKSLYLETVIFTKCTKFDTEKYYWNHKISYNIITMRTGALFTYAALLCCWAFGEKVISFSSHISSSLSLSSNCCIRSLQACSNIEAALYKILIQAINVKKTTLFWLDSFQKMNNLEHWLKNLTFTGSISNKKSNTKIPLIIHSIP